MDFKLPFSANGCFSIYLPRVTAVDCSTAVLILLGAAATSGPPNTAKIKFMVCQKLLMIQPPVAFRVPTVLLLSLYLFLNFNFFPSATFCSWFAALLWCDCGCWAVLSKISVYQHLFWTVAFVTVRFSFLSFDYSEKARIRTFPCGAHVTFVVLLTAGHSSGMG